MKMKINITFISRALAETKIMATMVDITEVGVEAMTQVTIKGLRIEDSTVSRREDKMTQSICTKNYSKCHTPLMLDVQCPRIL